MARILIFAAIAVAVYLALRSLVSRAAPEGAATDPYEVLGLTRGASPQEITRAYREKMKLYHPDRVNDLGPELRQIANQKTIEIQRAYEALRVRR